MGRCIGSFYKGGGAHPGSVKRTRASCVAYWSYDRSRWVVTGALKRCRDLSRQWRWCGPGAHLVCFLHAERKSDENWNVTAFIFYRADHRHHGCGLHLDYVEPQLQHDDDALRAASMMFKQYLPAVTKPGIIFGSPDPR